MSLCEHGARPRQCAFCNLEKKKRALAAAKTAPTPPEPTLEPWKTFMALLDGRVPDLVAALRLAIREEVRQAVREQLRTPYTSNAMSDDLRFLHTNQGESIDTD